MLKLKGFLKPYKKHIAAMLLLLFIQVLGTLYIPTLTADIVNHGIVKGDLDYVWQTGGFMLIIAFLTAAVSVLGTYLSTHISTGLGKDIRGALFRQAQTFSVHDFNRFGAASLITRSTRDITQIQQAFSIVVEMLLPAPFMMMAGLLLAFSKSRLLTLIILAVMAFIVTAALLLGKKVIPIYNQLQTMMDQINRTVRSNITGVRVIRAFNRTQQEKERTDRAFTDYANTAIKANKYFAVMMPMVMAAMSLCTFLVLWVGGQQVAYQNLQIGDIMAIIEYAMLVLMYLIMGVAVFMMIPQAHVSAARINAVLATGPEVLPAAGSGTDESSPAKVEFRNVTFRYEQAEEPVLCNLNFTVHKGQTTAVIGSTGSGKSTIAAVLLRFHEIQEGQILVDGKDIREYSQHDLRSTIGYVPQKAFLFSGTVADNLRHGNKDATVAQMHHALQIAQLDHFIRGLDKGLDAPVSQGGSNLSGGQKQRLSIARAVIKKPDLYLFDDSFSALDFKTDRELRTALKREVNDSAVMIVAQRISTIVDADQIIVLDNGEIAGKGTHRELLADCPVYRQIAMSQLSEEESA